MRQYFKKFHLSLKSSYSNYIQKGNMKTMLTNVDQNEEIESKTVLKTEINIDQAQVINCIFHDLPGHTLQDCNAFDKLNYPDKVKFASSKNLCFKCLKPNHRAADCKSKCRCDVCQYQHLTIMHRGPKENNERYTDSAAQTDRDNKVLCTQICQDNKGKSCSKTLLIDIYMKGIPDKTIRAYCIIDEQSNTTLVDDKIVNFFGVQFPMQEISINFASQNCELQTSGHVVSDLMVRGILEDEIILLPNAISVPNIANTLNEVATPDIARKHKHVEKFANCFPDFDDKAEVLLLIGRDCGRAMATQCLTTEEPYVHKSPLGYSLVGDVCLGGNKQAKSNTILRTHINTDSINVKYNFTQQLPRSDFNVFQSRDDDDIQGMSNQDKKFLEVMETKICITDKGNIELPLPLKNIALPDNKQAVFVRTEKTLNNLRNNPEKLDACVKSMSKSLAAQYIEEVDINQPEPVPGSRWYLPIFCVQQKKKSKIRLVYDASAKYHGFSLNDALLQGPDLNNKLRGVLLRFRERPIGFGADIEAMFNNFNVPIDQRDYLRFFWYKGNNPSNEIVPFRSTSHLFGCTSSPAVATYGLQFTTVHHSSSVLSHSARYINNSFYVDDGMYSTDTEAEAITILSESISLLKTYNMRLHKIVSNCPAVLKAFPESEIATSQPILPVQSSIYHKTLGITWLTDHDQFIISTDVPHKPYTKRGILSVINSIYDPLGILCPVILQGKIIQREVLPSKSQDLDLFKYGWDDILPDQYKSAWNKWLDSLALVKDVSLKRSFYPLNFNPVSQDLHAFADASNDAIGYVIYIRSINNEGKSHVAFVTAASKVSPKSASTIPRMELCAAVEAARVASSTCLELENKPDRLFMYSDSQITLGYIKNEGKRFTKYVERRIDNIHSLTKQEDWFYVNTRDNPADIATRPHSSSQLLSSIWFTGPSFLWENEQPECEQNCPDKLPEEKSTATIFLSKISVTETAITNLFGRCSNLNRILNVIKLVINFIRMKVESSKFDNIFSASPLIPLTRDELLMTLVKAAQQERYSTIKNLLESNKTIPECYSIAKLSPQLDSNGIIRVGGRIKRSDLPFNFKHPILIPKDHPLAILLARYYHSVNRHQGSHISHGALIQAGFHIENGRQLVRHLVKQCVQCRKIRAPTCSQLMADLPLDRLHASPPFTNVGVDVFGPFYIHDGTNTRRNKATKKIWVAIFVCLPSRAVHLEPLPGMDTSTFRNALSRFIAIRGNCKVIRSDQGTNFIASRKQIEGINLPHLSPYLDNKGIQWILNPPGASHHGGSWERKIGSIRRVMEASMTLVSNRGLSRDEFYTLLAEASAIVNNTPLGTLTNDPEDMRPLCPAMLMTLKDSPNPALLEDYTEADVVAYGQRRYRRVQYLAEQFWKRWQTEYLQTLTSRHKWKTKKPCLTKGDLVLLRNKQLPRNEWSLGRIDSTKVSADGLIRSVTVQVPSTLQGNKKRYLTRSINDLVLLIPHNEHPCINPTSL